VCVYVCVCACVRVVHKCELSVHFSMYCVEQALSFVSKGIVVVVHGSNMVVFSCVV